MKKQLREQARHHRRLEKGYVRGVRVQLTIGNYWEAAKLLILAQQYQAFADAALSASRLIGQHGLPDGDK